MGTTLAAKIRSWAGSQLAASSTAATSEATTSRAATSRAACIERSNIASVIESLASACVDIGGLLASEALTLGLAVGETPEGDVQKAIDVRAEAIMLQHLVGSPVAVVGSEEQMDPIVLDADAPLVVVTDPLDGSDNVDINAPIGTIFSIYRRLDDPLQSLLQQGTKQLAAGVIVYGPMTVLLLTVGEGTDLYALSPTDGTFYLSDAGIRIPERCTSFAINSSNYRHWPLGYQAYYNDVLAGVDSDRGKDFNTRWLGALVAEALRIFRKGGVYLYPGDARHGYEDGRLRLVYEANPIAMLVDQAGGKTTNGTDNILALVPKELHQRTPLTFGSAEEVEIVKSYHGLPTGSRSPLFANRGLFLSA